MSTMAANGSRRPRRQFSEEYRAQAVRLVLDEGKTVGAVPASSISRPRPCGFGSSMREPIAPAARRV